MPSHASQRLNAIEAPQAISLVFIKDQSGKLSATIIKNIFASLVRVGAVSLVAVVLPAFLTHHLSVTTYAAWVLILQLAAYVSYLDLGVQTAVSKFVAEFDARKDRIGAGRHVSAGVVLMTFAGILGLITSLLLAWQVPRLFSKMPVDLYHDVRLSVILVGISLSFGLICSVYSAVFLGLQRYWIPMMIAVINRSSFALIVIAVIFLHGSLVAMGAAVASVNVITGLVQVFAWQQFAKDVPITLRLVNISVLKTVARYCSFQSIWTFGMLCVAGLDVTIVGHYDYLQTGYYSIATLPISFLLLVMSAVMNPLIPASSAMSTRLSPLEMGGVLARITRYGTIILLLTGLPLIVCGLSILRLWVGESYAISTLGYLQVLIFANIIRNLYLPYATMITAIGKQEVAIITAISEAVVNLGCSIYLARHWGAMGVAVGTLTGSIVSVTFHSLLTMHFTYPLLAITRAQLFLNSICRPALIAIPSLCLLPLWKKAHTLSPLLIFVWAVASFFIAAYGALNGDERNRILHLLTATARLKSALRSFS